MNNTTEIQYENFDFESHKEKAVKNFENVRPLYETFSLQLKDIIVECLKCKSIRYHSIENRAKSIASFAEKAIKHSDNNPNKPKYLNPCL
jgi:ppGpp synthetase/RelA/SpoT-type nucleotidyltranferase